MKSLIVTVAGTATRFNRDTTEETLKCLYHIGDPKNSLLYQILDKARDIDEYVIVGGYLFDRLKRFAEAHLTEFLPKIKLVYNPAYKTFGSGFSLIKGIEALAPETDEIVFAEGDLFFDERDFEAVKNCDKNVCCINRDPITARKAVAVYETVSGKLRYLYDTAHKYLEIDEPFLAIYNSGQIWKFRNRNKLTGILAALSRKQIEGTNLEIIQGYFGDLEPDEYRIIPLKTWFNCNTVDDYKEVYSIINHENA